MAEPFDAQMLKHYPIIKPTELMANIVPQGAPLDMYTHKAVENNTHCFQELKHIV